MADADLLALAVSLAQRAGEIIISLRQGLSVSYKADCSPVTPADMASQRFIIFGLRGATPDIPIVSEEMERGERRAAHHCFWLVDPLDGTREFASGLNEFTVNIALVRYRRAILGAVAAPATGELFSALCGSGSWKHRNGSRVPIHARSAPESGMVAMISRHDSGDPALTPLLGSQPIRDVIKMGSGLKMCRLAEGAADFYPRPGRTMEWDTAAPQAILEGAGGSVRTLKGDRLSYGKPDWVNPSFICRGAWEDG